MEPLLYFPNSLKHKSPCGALEAGAPLKLTVFVKNLPGVYGAELELTKEGEADMFYPFTRTGESGEGGGGGAPEGYSAYSLSLPVTSKGLYFYRFLVKSTRGDFFAGADSFLYSSSNSRKKWQLTVYEGGYPAPDWLKGGIMYQIFPDRFCIGGERLACYPGNIYRGDWGGLPEWRPDENGKILNNDFFGGNFAGIAEKAEYLKSLGVTAVYLNPVFRAASNHKYDTGDYMEPDGDFGDVAAFKQMAAALREQGISLILDGVFSHTGMDSRYFNRFGNYTGKGAYQSKDSPYFSWYSFIEFPGVYECWWGHETLPNIRETEKTFLDFVCGESGVVAYWTGLGARGFRLDVADELPDAFLDAFYGAVKARNPEAAVLGEVWEDAAVKTAYGARRRYLQGGQMDSVMNYPFRAAILDLLSGGAAEEFRARVDAIINNYPARCLHLLMNMLGTHDTERALTALTPGGRNLSREESAHFSLTAETYAAAKKRLKIAAALQYTLPGVPCIYYGDEAGMQGGKDPFNRGCFPWGNQDAELTAYFRRLGKIRKKCAAALAEGGTHFLYAEQGLLIFMRGAESDCTLTGKGNAFTLSFSGEPVAVTVVNLSGGAVRINAEGGTGFLRGGADTFMPGPEEAEIIGFDFDGAENNEEGE